MLVGVVVPFEHVRRRLRRGGKSRSFDSFQHQENTVEPFRGIWEKHDSRRLVADQMLDDIWVVDGELETNDAAETTAKNKAVLNPRAMIMAAMSRACCGGESYFLGLSIVLPDMPRRSNVQHVKFAERMDMFLLYWEPWPEPPGMKKSRGPLP